MFADSGPHGRLDHPDICWKVSTAGHKQFRRFLKCNDDSFLAWVIEELDKGRHSTGLKARKDCHVGEGQSRLGCSDCKMVEFRMRREGTNRKKMHN